MVPHHHQPDCSDDLACCIHPAGITQLLTLPAGNESQVVAEQERCACYIWILDTKCTDLQMVVSLLLGQLPNPFVDSFTALSLLTQRCSG